MKLRHSANTSFKKIKSARNQLSQGPCREDKQFLLPLHISDPQREERETWADPVGITET